MPHGTAANFCAFQIFQIFQTFQTSEMFWFIIKYFRIGNVTVSVETSGKSEMFEISELSDRFGKYWLPSLLGTFLHTRYQKPRNRVIGTV